MSNKNKPVSSKKKFNLYRWFFFRSRGDSPFVKLIIHVVLIGACFISLYPALRVMTVSLRSGNNLLTTDLDIIPTGRVRAPADYQASQLDLAREKTQDEVQAVINERIASDVERNNTEVKNNLTYLTIQKLGGTVAGFKDLKDFVDNAPKLTTSDLAKKLNTAWHKVAELSGDEAQAAVEKAYGTKGLEERSVTLPSKTKVTVKAPAQVSEEDLVKTLSVDLSTKVPDKTLTMRFSKKETTLKIPAEATAQELDLVFYKNEVLKERKIKYQYSGKEITLQLVDTTAKKQSFKESDLEDVLYRSPAEMQSLLDVKLKDSIKAGKLVIERGASLKLDIPRNMNLDDIKDVLAKVPTGPVSARVLTVEGEIEQSFDPNIDLKALNKAFLEKSKTVPGGNEGVPFGEAYIMFRVFPGGDLTEVVPDFPAQASEGDNPAYIKALLDKQIRINKINQKDQQVFAKFTLDGKPLVFKDAEGKDTEIIAMPFNLGAQELGKDMLYKVTNAKVLSFNTATLNNYAKILFDKDSDFLLWIWNSLLITISTAFLGVALASTSAYAFSRFSFPGRKAGLIFLLTTQMIPGAMLMLPIYVLAKNLGLIGTWSGLVVAYSVGSIPFSVWILKGYYDTIPKELEEAATIDGATKMQTFFKIMLPLAAPALAIVFLFNFMQAWNDYMLARIMLPDAETHTWPLGLTKLQGQFNTQWGTFSAAALMVSVPVVALFLASSKYLVSGLTLGSVKG